MPPKTVSRFPAGSVEIPPSKSVSHRALICAALSEGESVLENIGDSRDISATLECLKALGARFRRVGNALVCRGTGGALVQARSALDCDESGSTLRFLLPVAALCAGETRFSGGGRLISRPLGPFEKEFPKHGAVLRAEGGGLTVRGPLTPGVFTLPGDVSSQFVTGLLFALPLLGGDSEIAISSPLESRSYVDLTLSCLGAFGIEIDNYKYEKFTVRGNQRFAPHNFRVEGDYSQAAFFLVAGALGAEVECIGLNPDSLQGDRRIVEILKDCGAEVALTPSSGLAAKAPANGGGLRARSIDVSDVPDLVPPLAALLCFCEGESRIYNAARLRYKESDRLAAVTSELGALGAEIAETPDGLVIKGAQRLRGGNARAWGDHRIAMMAACAALRCETPVTIDDPDCVSKSYPAFWRDFERAERGSIQ